MPRDFQRRQQNALVDYYHRGGGFGDAVQVSDGGGAAGADLDAVDGRQALILLQKAQQRRFTQAVQEDRLVVGQQPDIDKGTGAVDTHQQVDGLAGIAGNGDKVDRFEQIADGAAHLVYGPDGQPGVLFSQFGGIRKHLLPQRNGSRWRRARRRVAGGSGVLCRQQVKQGRQATSGELFHCWSPPFSAAAAVDCGINYGIDYGGGESLSRLKINPLTSKPWMIPSTSSRTVARCRTPRS